MNTGKQSEYSPGQLLPAVIEIAGRAAALILEIYHTNFSVDNKSDNSPLTAADTAAHNSICSDLEALTADIPVLSEESAAIPYAQRKLWNRYWLVDPLDGTREFVKKNGEFTVNIALVENHRPVLGVVYIPVTNTAYYAGNKLGAFKLAHAGSPTALHTKSTTPDHIVFAGSRSHGNEKQQEFFASLGTNTEIITIGSSLKFCMVAEGKVDIYPRFGPTSEWDTAAAQCIVEEAGGMVTDMNFKPMRYNSKESLLNPEFLVIADPDYDWKPYLHG